MNNLHAPSILAPRRIGTIIGLLVGIGFIAAAILLDRADPPRPVAHADHRSWVPSPRSIERDFAILETGDRR